MFIFVVVYVRPALTFRFCLLLGARGVLPVCTPVTHCCVWLGWGGDPCCPCSPEASPSTAGLSGRGQRAGCVVVGQTRTQTCSPNHPPSPYSLPSPSSRRQGSLCLLFILRINSGAQLCTVLLLCNYCTIETV